MSAEDELLAKFNSEDLRIEIYRGGVGCHVGVKVTHIPTGYGAFKKSKSERWARYSALEELDRKVNK